MKPEHKLQKLALIVTLMVLPCAVMAQQKAPYKSLKEALFNSYHLSGQSGPSSVNWIDGGNRFSYTSHDQSGREEIRSFNPKTKKDELIFNAKGLTFPGTDTAFNYRSFQWAHDSRHLVFKTHFRKIYRRSGISDYYVYSLKDSSLKIAAKNARTAELSPDGSMMGYERNGNMFVYDFNTRQETQLTNDATKHVFNGHYDWVYEEEFGQAQAWNWSPDNKYIAYWQVDESKEPVAQLTNYEGLHPKYVKIRYPQVGDPNPTVKIGVVNVKTGKKVWLDPGLTGDYYIPRIYWTSEPNTLAMITLNRAQNHMKLFFFNVVTGARRLVMQEKSKTWIDVYDFYAGVNDMISFPKNIHQFFWISDRDGWQHIYRYDYSGKLLNQVTKGDWSVTKVEGIDARHKKIYFASTKATPLQRQLYSISFNGKHMRQISKAEGRHQFNMSPNTKYYIDTYSNIHQPRQVEVWNTNGHGHMITRLVNNDQVKEYLKTHEYSPRELFHFTTTDGQKLDGYMIKPPNFDPHKKYPVILAIYGGPGSQSVYDQWETNGWHQYMAQQGYIIVDVNNRGNANYGSKFEKIVYEQLGKWETHDFAETAKYLSTLPYIDGQHMAIMGTSYGGYSTVYTMLTHPGAFQVGIADSPPTDWRLYDSIYTERYMGLLSDNKAGYLKSDALKYAGNLKGRLLLVHSAMDDNVHVRNTMQLLTALTNAGKDADLRLYPPGAHGAVYNRSSYLLLMNVYTQYLNKYLKGACNQPNINASGNN